MKAITWIRYIIGVLNAVAAGLETTLNHWPNNSFNDGAKKNLPGVDTQADKQK